MIASLTRRPFLGAVALGALHAILLGLAFPPVGLGLAGVLAPMPLLVLAMTSRTPWRSGLGAVIGSLPFWAYHHWWVFAVSAAGAPPLMLVQSIWPGLFVALGAMVVHAKPSIARAASLAIIWTGVEFLRGRLFFDGYPWFLIAHPTVDLPLAQWASVIGVYGVGFLIVLLGSLFLSAAMNRDAGGRRWVGPFACLLLLASGALLPGPGQGGSVAVGVVQTNLPQSNKMARTLEEGIRDFEEWGQLTLRAAQATPSPALLIWPETMFPGWTLTPEAIEEFAAYERRAGFPPDRRSGGTLFVEPLLGLQEQTGVPLLIGAIGYQNLTVGSDPDGSLALDSSGKFNSAFLIDNGRIRTERYDKIFLTPFGETMPYISRFPALEQAMLDFGAGGMSFDLTAGTVPVRFEIQVDGQATRFATPICFEATIPHVCRRLAYSAGERQADILVNMTNDGWFGRFDAGRANHLLIARWRAIELGTPVVRAANTGISCVVDASGRVRSSLPARQPASVLLAEVPLSAQDRTIYASIGDLAGWLGFLASCVLVPVSVVGRRRTRRASQPSHPASSPESATPQPSATE